MARGQYQMRSGSGDASGDGREILITGNSAGSAVELHTFTNDDGYWDVVTLEAMVVDAPGSDVALTVRYPKDGGGVVENTVTLGELDGPVVVREGLRGRGGGLIDAYTDTVSKASVRVSVERYREDA